MKRAITASTMIGARPIDGSSISISLGFDIEPAANGQHLLFAAAEHAGARPQPFAQPRE